MDPEFVPLPARVLSARDPRPLRPWVRRAEAQQVTMPAVAVLSLLIFALGIPVVLLVAAIVEQVTP
jgi:ABC-type proline/glycine betaine transport system permease subunit